MPAPASLIHQQSNSSGTGNLSLVAVTGRRSFSDAYGTGAPTNVFPYFAVGQSFDEWEYGYGHCSNSTTLVRDTVLKSSNADALVNFSGGIVDIMCDIPAENQIRNEGSTNTDGDLVVMDGTTGRKIKSAGVGRKGPTVQIFTSSGTWTKPAGCVKIKATIIGGGGAGGGVGAAATGAATAAGGYSGAAAIKFLDVTSISSLAVTVGAGGAAPAAGANGGNAGGNSGLGTANVYGQANGGPGGTAGSSATNDAAVTNGSSAATASNGDINLAGGIGGTGLRFGNVGLATSGPGASSYFGGGAGPVSAFGNSSNGLAGTAPGSGGSGAASATNTARSGGAGADGMVVIEEYYA